MGSWMGQENLSGKEVFPGWCPHCWGSSHSFQPDVLGQGTHRGRAEDVSPTRARALAMGLVGRVGMVPPSSQGVGGGSRAGGYLSLRGLWPHVPKHLPHPAVAYSGCGYHSGADPAPLHAQLWPTCLSISSHLALHRHQIHENLFSG